MDLHELQQIEVSLREQASLVAKQRLDLYMERVLPVIAASSDFVLRLMSGYEDQICISSNNRELAEQLWKDYGAHSSLYYHVSGIRIRVDPESATGNIDIYGPIEALQVFVKDHSIKVGRGEEIPRAITYLEAQIVDLEHILELFGV